MSIRAIRDALNSLTPDVIERFSEAEYAQLEAMLADALYAVSRGYAPHRMPSLAEREAVSAKGLTI